METGKRFEAKGTRIRLGRGNECEVRPVRSSDTIVSRVHAELSVGPSGGLVLLDAESKNGTFLNGDRIVRATPVRLGDKIMLGRGGPLLLVEGMGTAPQILAPKPAAPWAVRGASRTVWQTIREVFAKVTRRK
jgi:pSer/pThr/pTyr-binding forkhead associated (FHA) protein